jgi:predicted AlkP superfamily pyrophosphatase or phosphodiesterase
LFSGAPRALRKTRALVALAALAALLTLAAACAPRYVIARPGDLPRASAAPAASLTRNVVLVSVDGLRPDAIGRFAATILQRLMREGSYSLAARTILPSKTLPSHTSMLSGEPPDDHGVFWNNVLSAKADVVEFPTIFSVARAHGYRTAAFFSKAKFGPLQRPGTLDYSQSPGGWFGRWSSACTMADVRSYLSKERPNLLFVHLSDPDGAGHSSGWMSDAYGAAVRDADAAIGELVRTADAAYGRGNYSLLVTADHGGHGYDHGSNDPRDVTIPWIAWGRGVSAGLLQDVPIQTFDTAPTVLWLLGLTTPREWDGAPVMKAFLPSTATN